MRYRVGFYPKVSRWPNSINEDELILSTSDYEVLSRSSDTLIWRNSKIAAPKQLIYKLYFGRGPISWIRFHLYKFRVQREFEALFYLEQKKVPASRPVAWKKGRNPKLGDRYEVLVTEEIPNAVPFIDLWQDASIKSRQKLQLLHQCMQLISQMHDAGLHHGAMYPRNI